MRWTRSAGDGEEAAFLEGTSSDLADFGHSGSDGFASIWDLQDSSDVGTRSLHNFGPPDDDKRTQRARSLDRRSRRGWVVLGVLVIVGAAAAIAVQQGLLSNTTKHAPNVIDDSNVIVSTAARRVYSTGPAEVTISPSAALDSAFITHGEADPSPAQDLEHIDSGSVFGSLFWGGRSHIAVLGPALDATTSCVVVSLVADDLRVVDLAAHGRCGDQYAATGDRVACVGENIVVLEVWPYDPDAVVQRPEAATARVRIEADDFNTNTTESFRGTTAFNGQLLSEAPRMNGGPLDIATVRIGSVVGTCTLIDRAEIPVQLL